LGRKLPYKKVKSLPLGPGKGILITKKKQNEPIRVSGDVVIVKGQKNLFVTKKDPENQNCTKLCFSPETRVLKWKSRATKSRAQKEQIR
jgi:hypothetical protein